MKIAVILGIVLLTLACVGSVSAGGAMENILVNGGFESPQYQGTFTTLSGGQLDGWNIDKGDIQLINTYWQPHSGSQSIDLSGTVPGKISQTLNTIPGATYEITFWMSSNPDGNSRGQAVKEMQVSWDGTVLSPTYTYDSTKTSKANMGWTLVTIPNLKATKTNTVISFEELSPSGPYGIVLDDIAVIDPPTPAPEFPGLAVPAVIIVGMLCLVQVARRSEEQL